MLSSGHLRCFSQHASFLTRFITSFLFFLCALSFSLPSGFLLSFLFSSSPSHPPSCHLPQNHRETNYPPVHRQNQHPLNQSPIMSTAKTIHPRPVSLINHTLQPLTHHNCTPNHDSKPIYPASTAIPILPTSDRSAINHVALMGI